MRMLKFISFIFLLLCANFAHAQSPWENDGKGIGYHQIYGCQDTTGVKLDSMFRMTDSTGKLSICLSIGDLLDIINNYDGDDGGQGFFGCDSVQYCLENGTLCDVLSDFPTGNYTSGNYLFGVDNGGMCKRLNIMNIAGVGDTCRIINNSDCSYSLVNENATQFKFGYKLSCINDSMFTLTDFDGTSCGDTCTILGSAGGGGGSGSFNCDSVEACVSEFLCDSVLACLNNFLCDSVKACLEDGILCEVLSGLEAADSEVGDKYVTIKDGECVLTDSIKIDLCGIIQEIQEESDLAEDDIAFILRGGNCFKVPISTRSTDCIDVQIDAGDIIATPVISGNAGNIIQCLPSGFYATATLDFNCDSLHGLFGTSSTADSIFATNGGDCVKIPFPGSATVNCDTIASIFSAGGTLDAGDFILTINTGTGTCQRVSGSNFIPDCERIRNIFNNGSSDPDSLLAFKTGTCVRIPTSDVNVCEMTLTHWDLGSCEEPKIVVQCPDGCKYMTPCDIQDYVCAGLTAPFSPMMISIDRKIEKEVTKQLSFKPTELINRAAQYDYPTVDNMGIRTFKSKRQAELSEIPIGGIYYIEGAGNMFVKTRQRNK